MIGATRAETTLHPFHRSHAHRSHRLHRSQVPSVIRVDVVPVAPTALVPVISVDVAPVTSTEHVESDPVGPVAPLTFHASKSEGFFANPFTTTGRRTRALSCLYLLARCAAKHSFRKLPFRKVLVANPVDLRREVS
jgi:hypothetical protein